MRRLGRVLALALGEAASFSEEEGGDGGAGVQLVAQHAARHCATALDAAVTCARETARAEALRAAIDREVAQLALEAADATSRATALCDAPEEPCSAEPASLDEACREVSVALALEKAADAGARHQDATGRSQVSLLR